MRAAGSFGPLTRLLSAAVVTLGSPAVLAAQSRPNIVYVMADELGYFELSCMGHPHIQTPRIDAMARAGIRFTQALAGSSLCAPTRCSLLTGKHAGHTSVRTNGGGTPLRASEQTIASVLKSAGYVTGGFGKWGCGGRGSTGVPEKHGFDVFFGYYDQVHAHSYYPAYLVRNSAEVALPGNRGGRSGKTYAHYVIVDEAKKFIRAHKDRPFFCYMPVTPPHGMFDIPEDDPAWRLYADKPWPLEARRYAAMVTMLDRHVGEVLDLLQELGLARKTLVFFCGDNGGNDYFKSGEKPRGFHAPNVDPKTGTAFRGRKGNLYEGGLRVPMIARWSGRIDPGRVSDLPWYFPDVLPTLAELAGARTPDDIDGLSIVPELLGAQAAGHRQRQHEFLYWELGRQRAVRLKNWKAVQPRRGRAWELYDLGRDVSEQNDVAAEHPQVLARMKRLAASAHEEAEPGVFLHRAAHERDRQAKWGAARPGPARIRQLPREGLLATTAWRLVRVSSESAFNGRLAINAIDGDPRTLWHTRWRDDVAKHPHELVIDLGGEHEVRGLRYLARQDRGWNGTFRDCEISLGLSRGDFGDPVGKVRFARTKRAQEATWEPVRCRYVRVRILSEIGGGPWASAAEIGLIGK